MLAALLAAAALTTAAPAASVREHAGDIDYIAADGAVRPLTHGGNFSEPVLSPDGRTVVFIRRDGAAQGFDGPPTSLWIADGPSGETRLLIGPHPSDEPKLNFASFEHPVFSLDGHDVYVSADAWVTSPATHQVSLAAGQERYVIDGETNAVIRTGPYRGFLLVGRHMYFHSPKGGSYDPVYVVRPDGRPLFAVPGSIDGDADVAVARWLKSHGWRAD